MKNINFWKTGNFVFGGVAAAMIGYHFVPEAQAKGPGEGCGDQPHMQAALNSLGEAESQLKAATPDKGGNRVVGLQETSAAIAAINRGCRFSNNH